MLVTPNFVILAQSYEKVWVVDRSRGKCAYVSFPNDEIVASAPFLLILAKTKILAMDLYSGKVVETVEFVGMTDLGIKGTSIIGCDDPSVAVRDVHGSR